MVTNADEPQIQNCATEPLPLFQQLAGGNPARCDDVRQIPAVTSERRRSAGRTRDQHLPRDSAFLVEQVWTNVRRRDPQQGRCTEIPQENDVMDGDEQGINDEMEANQYKDTLDKIEEK